MELSITLSSFFLYINMDVFKLISAMLIVMVSWIVSGVAFIVRILAHCLLDIHLFLEWCMYQLVKGVETLYPKD